MEIKNTRKQFQAIDEVKNIKDLKARTSGSQVMIDVIITLHPNLTVKEVDDIVIKIKLVEEKHNGVVTSVETQMADTFKF